MICNYVCLRKPPSDAAYAERPVELAPREIVAVGIGLAFAGEPERQESIPAHAPSELAPQDLFEKLLGVEFPLADELILQKKIPIHTPAPHQQDLRDCFNVLAAAITEHLCRDKQLVAIVDAVDLCRLNPLRNRGWESLVAMLIQAFPEVRWIFGKVLGCPSDEEIKKLSEDWRQTLGAPEFQESVAHEIAQLRTHWGEVRDNHEVSLLFEPLGSPLFDDGGLRHWIRTVIRVGAVDDPQRREAAYLRKRRDLAVVLDEERDFRDFHALMAYGRGLRVNAIETWSEAKRSLDSSQLTVAAKKTYQHLLTIEDVYLNYPDQTVTGMSNLDDRVENENLPLLAEFKHRRFVTVGHDRSRKRSELDCQLRILRLKHSGRHRLRRTQQMILKPAAGIYNLWYAMGLDRHLREELEDFQPKRRRSLHDTEDDHSSPGRLLRIAECLIARAKRHRGEIHSVSDAVNCAMLAIQAYELLGGLTPVLSLEALTLRHELEVIAECQFAGVQHHLDIKSRMADIRQQVESISRYCGSTKSKRKLAAFNAELAIVGRLVDVFRKYDQFDEERILLTRIRAIHRKLKFLSNPAAFKPLEIFPAYAERLLASFPLFLFAIFAWIVVVGVAHWHFIGINLDEGIAAAFMTFLGTGSSGGESVWKPGDGMTLGFGLVSFTILLGFVHLGIFISHLYSIINRK
jgi:hypothetical protein